MLSSKSAFDCLATRRYSQTIDSSTILAVGPRPGLHDHGNQLEHWKKFAAKSVVGGLRFQCLGDHREVPLQCAERRRAGCVAEAHEPMLGFRERRGVGRHATDHHRDDFNEDQDCDGPDAQRSAATGQSLQTGILAIVSVFCSASVVRGNL
jgi:hypothetical protein